MLCAIAPAILGENKLFIDSPELGKEIMKYARVLLASALNGAGKLSAYSIILHNYWVTVL